MLLYGRGNTYHALFFFFREFYTRFNERRVMKMEKKTKWQWLGDIVKAIANKKSHK